MSGQIQSWIMLYLIVKMALMTKLTMKDSTTGKVGLSLLPTSCISPLEVNTQQRECICGQSARREQHGYAIHVPPL